MEYFVELLHLSERFILETFETLCAIWYHLYNFKKREKHPWKNTSFSKAAGFSLQFY